MRLFNAARCLPLMLLALACGAQAADHETKTPEAAAVTPAATPEATPAPAAAAPVFDQKLKDEAVAKRVGKKFTQARGLKDKLVALTFDDGPDPARGPQILAILKKENVPATFFLLGIMMEQNPQAAKNLAEAGIEIGTHTWDHKKLNTLGAEKIRDEIKRAQDKAEEITGVRPKLFRPPYGSLNKSVQDICVEEGVVLVNWSVDTNDWRAGATQTSIIGTVDKYATPGGIVLMHEIHDRSIAALPGVIKTLKDKGYTFVTVSDIIAADEQASREGRGPGAAVDGGGPPPPPEKIIIPLSESGIK